MYRNISSIGLLSDSLACLVTNRTLFGAYLGEEYLYEIAFMVYPSGVTNVKLLTNNLSPSH